MLLVYVCQDVLSALMELNDSHYIERNEHYLGYVIELDVFTSSFDFCLAFTPKCMFYDITALYVRIILSLKKMQKITYHLT